VPSFANTINGKKKKWDDPNKFFHLIPPSPSTSKIS